MEPNRRMFVVNLKSYWEHLRGFQFSFQSPNFSVLANYKKTVFQEIWKNIRNGKETKSHLSFKIFSFKEELTLDDKTKTFFWLLFFFCHPEKRKSWRTANFDPLIFPLWIGRSQKLGISKQFFCLLCDYLISCSENKGIPKNQRKKVF